MTAPLLLRRIFKTSRLAEFCSKKELMNQTGHPVHEWPLVILKELVDNALEIRVIDKGKGIPEKEREKVFQVYYRRDASKGKVPGTGLGLHIAREILRAHGGSLHVEGSAGSGAEFCLRLPLDRLPPREAARS